MKTNRTVQDACDRLKSLVLFENAGFRLHKDDPLSQTTGDTKLIKEATNLYTRTWILPILDAIQAGDMNRLREIID